MRSTQEVTEKNEECSGLYAYVLVKGKEEEIIIMVSENTISPMLASTRSAAKRMRKAAQNAADRSGCQVRCIRYERVRTVEEFKARPQPGGETSPP